MNRIFKTVMGVAPIHKKKERKTMFAVVTASGEVLDALSEQEIGPIWSKYPKAEFIQIIYKNGRRKTIKRPA